MTRLFLDTGVLVAAISPRDDHHDASLRLLARICSREWESVHTSDFVLAEALNFVSRKIRKREAADILVGLVFGREDSPPVVTSVARIHGGRFAAALDEIRSKWSRGLSLTDWTTITVMRELKIHTLATFDAGFKGLVPVVPG